MASTRLHTTKRAGAVALALAAGSTGLIAATTGSASAMDWNKVAQCESGGNWSTNTGNGYSGGLQFSPSTWSAYGGSGSPSSASQSEQIAVANKVLAAQGPGAWPVCSQGATGGSTASSSYNSTDTAASRSYSRHSVSKATTSKPTTTATRSYKPTASSVYLSEKLQRQYRADVKAWQEKLIHVSHFNIQPDGHFGPQTAAATKALQQRNHKQVDGIVGPQTRSIYAS